MIKLSAALAALGLFALPSVASADTAQDREGVSVRISTEGVNPQTPEGLAKLRQRTARAISEACKSGERLNTSLSPDWRCRNELGSDAETKIAAVSRHGRFASR